MMSNISDQAETELADIRCNVTGNLVGTDTVTIGAAPCVCNGCRLAALIASRPAPRPSDAGVSTPLLGFFTSNVDTWGAAEWFERLVKALREQDAAVLSKNDLAFEACKNIAASSAMRLVRDFEHQIRTALTAPVPTAAGEPVAWQDIDCDDPSVIAVAKAIAQDAIGRSWDDFLPINGHDIDQADLIDYARAAIAALPNSAADVRAKVVRDALVEARKVLGGTPAGALGFSPPYDDYDALMNRINAALSPDAGTKAGGE